MSNAAIAKELAELHALVAELRQVRKEVAELNQTRKAKSVEAQQSKNASPEQARLSESDRDETEIMPIVDAGKSEIEAQIQEFIDALEEEIKDTNPMTMLVVFALGILIGRFLPR